MSMSGERIEQNIRPDELPFQLPPWFRLGRNMLNRRLGLDEALDHLNALDGLQGGAFFDALLERMRVEVRVRPRDGAAIPRSGRLMVVCNHPTGGIDGIVSLAAMLRVRPDVKMVANRFLTNIPHIESVLLPVDPPRQKRRTSVGIRDIVEHLKADKALFVFPAGWVASRQDSGVAVDGTWNPILAKIIRHCRTPVQPFFVNTVNTNGFYRIRSLNRGLGSLLLVRELLGKQGQSVELRVGEAIAHDALAHLSEPAALMGLLRERTYALADRPVGAGMASA